MDKLSLQKAIESLKNTECNTKEKIAKFDQIQSSLAALQTHSNYKTFLSSAIQILLLFCEDNDSNCRISAEENLNRIIRNAERQNQIVLVQIDLYHDLKKNGNERSLRICLNLFSHFSHLIKHRRRKVYAQNLLPCLLAVGKRKEPLVIESLCEFMKSFSKNLLDCLTDGELLKLVDLYVDNLSVECAIKRRCSAQNVLSMLDQSAKKDFLLKSIVIKIQETLSKNPDSNSVLGTLGLLRLLTPLLVTLKTHHHSLLELLETCLTYLKTESNHSIINANLEVVNALLASSKSSEFAELITDSEKMLHKEMLLSKRSMSAFINQDSRNSSDAETLRITDSFLQVPSASTSVMSTPNKSATDFSDVEGDSFKSIDFETEISSSPATTKNFIERGAETMSLKSTDSINSFFNSIASNTETVSKFFRKSSTESPAHQPKLSESVGEAFDYSINQLKDENTELPDSQSLPETAEIAMEESRLDETLELVDSTSSIEPARELYIGTIFDQSVVEYTVRLVASKFLLDGTPGKLICDQIIRVSIKNLALSVIAGCVELKSDVLVMKLQKDYTDESMMVESLLSYLVDEDLRLEEEEKKKVDPLQDEAAASTSEAFLEIKDDHFGECTTATFLDYFSPLSKSLDDQGLITLKNRIYEEKNKNREESAKKINRDLCQLLSRSEIIESKLPQMETSLKPPEDKDCQFVADVLLYSGHSDPVLRGNVCLIVGRFMSEILKRNLDYQKFISRNEIAKESLEFNKLVDLLVAGLKDEIHTVVKQTLTAVEGAMNQLIAVMNKNLVTKLMNQLLLVFCNKYWLVQCKYCDVVTSVDLKLLKNVLGDEADAYERQVIDHLFELVKDNDFRVRSHVSELMPAMILRLCKYNEVPLTNNNLNSFVAENLLNFESFFVDVKIQHPGSADIELQLTRFLYTMGNYLMNIRDKNQHFGVIHALKILARRFSPLQFPKAWKEFNILSVLLSFINKNPGIALDISCQCDMIELISSLVSASCILNLSTGDMREFLLHLLRILNIYGHLLTNTKPLIVPKQKSKDIFTSSKELAMINSLGFFSSDHFYLKLYLVLKSSYESFRMTINQDAELKLKHLLHVTLKALQSLLELKTMTKDDVKLLEETVHYLSQVMSFQPEDCIVTTKILLKFLFQRNFVNRRSDLESIIESAKSKEATNVFEKFENFSSFDASEVARESSFESSIKQFDPLVIQSLRLFSKSPAKLQSIILDMLCQLLEFNVNYMQLDAKKVFVEFVMRQLEYIESGLVIEGKILSPRIIQFLIFLTKLKDKKFITTPKIINIIDNQLASTNPVVKECGVHAMLVLMKELFFKKVVVKGEPEVIEALKKDLNAQREVVVSMMMKFLNHREIQESFVWILMKAKVEPTISSVVDENEIYQQLLQSMRNEPGTVHSLIAEISKNILLESKNFEGALELYLNFLKDEENCEAFEVITSIQSHVLTTTEEVYVMNHLKLYQQKQKSGEEESLRSFLELHHKLLIKLLTQGNLSELEKLTKFLSFKKFPTFLEVFKQIVDCKAVIKATLNDSSVLDCAIKFLLTIEVKPAVIAEALKIQSASNEQKIFGIFHQNRFEHQNDINAWENDELMDFFKDNESLEIFLKHSKNILLDSLLEDREISRIILRKLTKVKVPLERVKYLLEHVNDECLIESLIFVITATVHGSPDARVVQLTMCKKLHTVRNEILMGRESVKVTIDDFEKIKSKVAELQLHKKFPTFVKAVEDFTTFLKLKKSKEIPEVDSSDLEKVIDESWLLQQAKSFINGSEDIGNGVQIAKMLLEIKSESKLITLLTNDDFNVKLLPCTLSVSFEKMLKSFRMDCAQLNPHLNYMKISPLLKISILILVKNLDKLNENSEIDRISQMASVMTVFLDWLINLYNVSLVYVEAKLVEKFIAENFLKTSFRESIGKFFQLIVKKLKIDPSEVFVETISRILSKNQLWLDVNTSDESTADDLVSFIYEHFQEIFKDTEFVVRYQQPQLFDELPVEMSENVETAKRIIFIARIQEEYENGEFTSTPITSKSRKIVEKIFEISRNLLRLQKFYAFTVTPYEILLSYRSGDDLLVMQSENSFKLKQIPIEYLSDSELLEHYIRRIHRYGFTARHQFEEVFMTLLVLLNQWNEMQDAEEQFNIKQLCLETNVDLIVSCFRQPAIGLTENSFFHLPRSEKIKLNSIGLEKLHHIQDTLASTMNVFYQPNLERIGNDNNSIACAAFGMNQFALNYTWQIIETREEVAASRSMISRNVEYYHEKCGIDFKSALQLIYDLMTQMIDESPVMVLPQLVKLLDILDSVDQFKWINKKMLSLYESIAGEDSVSHQYIVYLLCRSSAVLVPSLSEVQHLIVIMNKYLGCNQLFVRNACIHGLLCLFESLCKTNTTMGAMSDEMKLLRICIVNYTNKNGIIYENNISSPTHDKLVWTLNFYTIEMTTKFLSDIDLLTDSVISANNILKRTNDLDLFYLILNGLERLVILNPDRRLYREKMEKLALDLMRMENKLFSIGGLKLLVTCLYIGSLEQLENTEKSNGIVQDEPEILMQSTEKIEILFTRIRTATLDEAEVYGEVLGQILKDLLPPNEIITKVIKELLIMNQSNCVCIAAIIHQVFRSAIDSSYLVLLQEWLICSLQNFLSYPNNKKSIWFLSLIFLSSTLNQNLLKLFPILLDENLDNSQLHRIFLVSAKDFHDKLSNHQKVPFKDAFMNRIKTKMMSSSAYSPSNSFAFNNSLFQILLQHL